MDAVTLRHSVRGRHASVTMTAGPILRYCPACHHTPPEPYPYHGSRYGQVGAFTCGHCGAQVSLTDGDCHPPVVYHARPTPAAPTVTETIRFEALYRITEADFRQVERWTGLRLLGDTTETIGDFPARVERVAAEVARRALPPRPATPGLPFVTWVPQPFRVWLDLYATLEGAGQSPQGPG